MISTLSIERFFPFSLIFSSYLPIAAVIPTLVLVHSKFFNLILTPLNSLFGTSVQSLPSQALAKLPGIFLRWELYPLPCSLVFRSPVTFHLASKHTTFLKAKYVIKPRKQWIWSVLLDNFHHEELITIFSFISLIWLSESVCNSYFQIIIIL